MLTINKTNISLTRGDSAYITLKITDKSGQPVELTDGDTVRCQVRDVPNTGDLIFEGKIIKRTEDVLWYIKPADTNEVDAGKYYWDAQVEFSNGDIFTFVPVSTFEIIDEVTMRED